MLVDVVELRRRGIKRPRAEVLAAAAIRAELSLTEDRPGWHRGQRTALLLAGVVVPGRSEWALAPLDYAWVKIIRNGDMLILGVQQSSASHCEKDIKSFPQAWWCRFVATAADDASADEDPPDRQCC